jgi:tetratricopeptide (TPR) repeat protein
MIKPKIFIGSSVEGLNIAYAVQQNLTHDAEITVWDQGVFELSQTTIESLVAALDKSDFAVFVFSPDDITKIRTKKFQTVRDNVIFELGMFIGKLGRHRSFIIMPDKPAFHIPTDLLGVTAGKYDTSRTDGSYQAATGPVCHQIRTQIRKLGLLQTMSNEATAEKEISESDEKDKLMEKGWWIYYLEKDYTKAIELIDKEIENSTESDQKDDLGFWKIYIEYKIDSKKGKEVISEKLQIDFDRRHTYSAVTRILLWEDELDFALKIINEGLTKFPNDEILISRKSEYLEKIGKIEEAISVIIEIAYEGNEDLSIKLADLYEKLETKKTEDAFLIIKKAYVRDPSSKQLAYKLARLAQDTDRQKLALNLLDKLTKKYPENIEYWGYLGNACVYLGIHNKAMIAYKKANELSDSKQSWILSNIGNLLQYQGFFTDGKEYFKKSLAMDPESEYSFSRLAGIIKSETEENEKYSNLLKEGLSLITDIDDIAAADIGIDNSRVLTLKK